MAKMLAMPIDIEKKCRQYCDIRKIKEATLLRLVGLKKVPVLHDAATLNRIVERTHNSDPAIEYVNVRIFLPEETVKEFDKYSAFFKLGRKKCRFLYYLIEDELQETMEELI